MDNTDLFATRVYVIGELIISLLTLGLGVALVYFGAERVELVGAGLVSAVTVFWFQRRASESSADKIQHISNGNLTSLRGEVAALKSDLTHVLLQNK